MTSEPLDLRAIARRAAGRALAARGREIHPQSASTLKPRPAGIHVDVGAASRPGGKDAPSSVPEKRPLVTVDCLADIPDGGMFRIARDAQVTPLACEEAWRRGIRFETGKAVGGRASLRVAVGADHGGFAMKRDVLAWLKEMGHRPADLGTRDEQACDYPDFARAVAEAVASGQADFGICVDGAGIGSAMAANKVRGVLAANCWNERSAKNAREHNHANVLTLGAVLTAAEAYDVVRVFLATPSGAGRHARRVAKIQAFDRRTSDTQGVER